MAVGGVRPGDEAYGGQAAYNPLLLAAYDVFALRFSGRYVWHCPAGEIVRHYDDHVSGSHLDIGVGTGFFLDKCRFPTEKPEITLMDLNDNSLGKAARRIRRYAPRTHVGNVLEPIDLPEASFRSIGMNWLLHCLPGTMDSKALAFQNVKPLLDEGGVVFGSTFLGKGVEHSRMAISAFTRANAKGFMCNLEDDPEGLQHALDAHFPRTEVRTEGSVTFFAAYA